MWCSSVRYNLCMQIIMTKRVWLTEHCLPLAPLPPTQTCCCSLNHQKLGSENGNNEWRENVQTRNKSHYHGATYACGRLLVSFAMLWSSWEMQLCVCSGVDISVVWWDNFIVSMHLCVSALHIWCRKREKGKDERYCLCPHMCSLAGPKWKIGLIVIAESCTRWEFIEECASEETISAESVPLFF